MMKDLRVVIDRELKFHDHTTTTITTVNRLLGIIRKSFMSLNSNTLPYLYEVLIRPVIEYGNTIWGPFYALDQQKIEALQRKATRLVTDVKHLSYEECLIRLNLPSLSHRRYRGDMIQVYNIINYRVNLAPLFVFYFFHIRQPEVIATSCTNQLLPEMFANMLSVIVSSKTGTISQMKLLTLHF